MEGKIEQYYKNLLPEEHIENLDQRQKEIFERLTEIKEMANLAIYNMRMNNGNGIGTALDGISDIIEEIKNLKQKEKT